MTKKQFLIISWCSRSFSNLCFPKGIHIKLLLQPNVAIKAICETENVTWENTTLGQREREYFCVTFEKTTMAKYLIGQ